MLDRVFTCFPRLKERLAQAGGTLSDGEQQALAIGRALVGKPRLLLLDEPSEGLMPSLVALVENTLHRLHSRFRQSGDGLRNLPCKQPHPSSDHKR